MPAPSPRAALARGPFPGAGRGLTATDRHAQDRRDDRNLNERAPPDLPACRGLAGNSEATVGICADVDRAVLPPGAERRAGESRRVRFLARPRPLELRPLAASGDEPAPGPGGPAAFAGHVREELLRPRDARRPRAVPTGCGC